MSTWRILVGDVREQLATLPAGSVQTCVTSPPYWGLRDYGHAGQLGLEPTPAAYVAAMVEVFAGVWRVLRDDGTCWINLGDSYNAGTTAPSRPSVSADVGGWTTRSGDAAGARRINAANLKPKDLVGIPWMVAFALRDAGWYLRSDIIWAKPNPMPESVTDRPTKAHEYIFLLTKSARYYYDAEAIKEEGTIAAGTKGAKGSAERFGTPGVNSRPPEYKVYDGTRNKRSVWTVATQPYPEAHFATYPEALIEPCILAGTSERGQCPACGAPWARVVERTAAECRPTPYDAGRPDGMTLRGTEFTGGSSQTVGWQPSCECHAGEPVPQLVLDPFTGSGTTGAVAIRHQRSFVGCELNPQYVELARKRIGAVAPLLSTEVA